MKKPCKIWPGAKSKAGYGQFRRKGVTYYVHRREWEKAHGPLPKGVHVLHECDTPACYELEHLFLGNQKINMKDMVEKKRHAHGMTHGRAKLTDAQIVLIRADPRTQKTIAADYAVHHSLISYIKAHKIWKEVH